ncbi:MAG: DUF362 domain-containing protein [Mailhella sp.]|nr:DUF362 domain-containing protein [Mailhella sp.]
MAIRRRKFMKTAAVAAGALQLGVIPGVLAAGGAEAARKPGTGGEKPLPYEKRTGPESVVWFTRDLSAAGLRKIYARVRSGMSGKVAIKLHTGEKNGPNIIPRSWVRELIEGELPGAAIVETNTYYAGDRCTTAQHRETLRVNGWDFAPVDIIDENGTAMLPVKGGKWFTEMSMGKGLLDYDSLLVLTHFKGHAMGGFGGSAKNIGIGCADGRIGKGMIHSRPGGGQWSVTQEEFMERMMESAKATVDHFGSRIAFINVLRNMSVSCDCEGVHAAPVVTPDIGIVASPDILAADQASVDLVLALPERDRSALLERISSRHGFRQLTYMKELGMGNDRYRLLDLDNGGAELLPAAAVAGVRPFRA